MIQITFQQPLCALIKYAVLPSMEAFFLQNSNNFSFHLIFIGFAAGSVLSGYFSLCYSIGLDTSHFLRFPKVNTIVLN